MIEKDFQIDFQNRRINHNPRGSGDIYTINELYSFLQEISAQPQNMNYNVPIAAGSRTKYHLTDGWTIDEEAMKYLKGGDLILEIRSVDGKKFKVLGGY